MFNNDEKAARDMKTSNDSFDPEVQVVPDADVQEHDAVFGKVEAGGTSYTNVSFNPASLPRLRFAIADSSLRFLTGRMEEHKCSHDEDSSRPRSLVHSLHAHRHGR